jgi:nucleotide-binding universal stress UspA family protein
LKNRESHFRLHPYNKIQLKNSFHFAIFQNNTVEIHNPGDPAMFRKILIGTDLTSKSYNALRLAASLAQGLSAELFVLHVISLPPKLKGWSSPVVQENKSYKFILQSQVAAAEIELGNQIRAMCWASPKVLPLVTVGDPPKTIAAMAKKLCVDVIVVARGSGGVLGSVAEQVVRLTGQTVLVAPIKWPRRMNAFLTLPVSLFQVPLAGTNAKAAQNTEKRGGENRLIPRNIT